MQKRGKRLVLLISLLFLLFLLLLLVLPLTSASNNKTTPATIIPTPDGVYIYLEADDNMSFLLQENTGTTFINDEGEVEYRAIYTPFGEVLNEEGIDPNSITKPWNSWDDDVDLYVGGESYDPKSGVWLGLHWPTLGKEIIKTPWRVISGIFTAQEDWVNWQMDYMNIHGGDVPPLKEYARRMPFSGGYLKLKEGKDIFEKIEGGALLTADIAGTGAAVLGVAGYNPVLWGGKAAAPTTTALMKYDKVFADWQKSRIPVGPFSVGPLGTVMKGDTLILRHYTTLEGLIGIKEKSYIRSSRKGLLDFGGKADELLRRVKITRGRWVYLTDQKNILERSPTGALTEQSVMEGRSIWMTSRKVNELGNYIEVIVPRAYIQNPIGVSLIRREGKYYIPWQIPKTEHVFRVYSKYLKEYPTGDIGLPLKGGPFTDPSGYEVISTFP